ncbi:MAG: hypothetical protein AAGD23_08555 [Pseudomonadota bacterium]
MRGIILAYERESNAGLIRGEDGNRYGFRAQEWRERTQPLKGVSVDFEPDGPLARDIYIIMPTDSAADGEPVSFLIATRTWIANHPEALVATMILIACGLPFYRFLGIETTLYQAPEILLRLSAGLERIRALAQQVPSAATAAAMIKMLLPGIYVLWIIPLLAAYVLYRALFDLPRLGLLRVFGFCSLLLPVLVPVMVVVPTWFLVVQSIPAEQQITLLHSVFDLPRFGPLREIALGAVATMILGLGLFLWSINPDNVDERAAARQGTTHRSGRSRAPQRPQGAPLGQAASASHPPAMAPGPSPAVAPGMAEAFAPPRLRSRPAPGHPGGPPQQNPQHPDQLRQMPAGAQQGPQPSPYAPPGSPFAPPHAGQPIHPGQVPQGVGPGAPTPLPPETGGVAPGQPPYDPALHGNGAGAAIQPQPGFDEGLPHHDPIPESLRRRFEERQQRLNQQPPQAAAVQQAPAPPPEATAPAQPQNAMAALPPPEAYNDVTQDPAGVPPQAMPAEMPNIESPSPGPDPMAGASPTEAAQSQFPDARDGFGVPVNASVSGWSVNPGQPRYDFDGLDANQPAAQTPDPGVETEQPYASLAEKLRLAPRGAAEPQGPPPTGSNGPVPNQIAGPPRPAQPPKTLEALAAGARSRPKPPPEPEVQDSPVSASSLTEPPSETQPAVEAESVQTPGPADSPKKPEIPPPPKEITDFLRLLDEPDGLRKLAAVAPSPPGFPPSPPPGDRPTDASKPSTPSAGSDAVARPETPQDVPSASSEKQPDQQRSRGNGVSPPPPPPPDDTLEHALDRAMERLNGGLPSRQEEAPEKDTGETPAATSDAAKTVTALYERLRQERSAKEPKSDLPIPPVPPRR